MAITTCGGGCYHFVGRVLEEVRHPRRPVFSPTLALTNVVPVGPWSQRIANHDTRMISPNIDIDHASYCGYLYKQSKHLKRFRRRYCVLIIDKLYTFKQPEDVPRGLVTEILDLALADYLVEWEISPRVPNYNMIAGKFSFEIGTEAETPSRREWMFAAESEHDRREWIHKLGSYCRHVWRPSRSGLEGQLRLFSASNKVNKTRLTLSAPSGRTIHIPLKAPPSIAGPNKDHQSSQEEEKGGGVADLCHDNDDDDESIIDCEYSECCCICLKQFSRDESVWQLCCGHYFCVRCIQNWSKYKRTCPVCRDVF